MTAPVERHDSEDASAPSNDYDVRPDIPVYVCDRCGRPVASEHSLALHRGLAHPADLDDEEVAAFREAHAEEEAQLRRFRLKALGGLVGLYFGLLVVYALV